jgi:hypothetical protein
MKRNGALGTALCIMTLLHTGAAAQERSVLAQQDIQTTVTRMLHAIDALDWLAFRASFLPRVRIDYTSLWGGQAETVSLDTLLDRWQPLAHGFDATQHQIGPLIVVRTEGNRATAETQVRAYHYVAGAAGGAVWMVAGKYVFTMQQEAGAWRIAGITLQVAYQEGNRDLPSIARDRSAAGLGRPRRAL